MSLKDKSIDNKSTFYKLCRNNANRKDTNLLDLSFADRLNISDDEIAKIITNPMAYYYRFNNPIWTYSMNMVYFCLCSRNELPDTIIKAIFNILHYRKFADDEFYRFTTLCRHICDNGVNIKNADKLAKLCLEEYESRRLEDVNSSNKIILHQVIYDITRLIEDDTIPEFGYIFEMICMNEKMFTQAKYGMDNCAYLEYYLAKDVINEDLIRSMMDSDKDYINLAAITLAGYNIGDINLLDEALNRFIEKYPNFYIRDYTRNTELQTFSCRIADLMTSKNVFDIVDKWKKSKNKYLSFIGKDAYKVYEYRRKGLLT